MTGRRYRRYRRTATDLPSAKPQALHDRDGVALSAGSDAGRGIARPGATTAGRDQCGAVAAGRDLPGAVAVSLWRPRPTTPEELDEARTALLVHRWDPDTGRCAGCSGACPCREAHAAARVLAQAGAWNTMPSPGLVSWQADREPTRAGGGWLARLVRRLRWMAAAQ
jgi:hypothetical protein